MPRGPRLDAPNALHHVMARGIERDAIFRDDHDRTNFLDRLAGLVTAGQLSVYAWALLTNHLHLLLRTGGRSLSRSMHRLLGGYASAFNTRHHRVGYLFQSRFKSILAQEEPYFRELVRYIHLNPLRARLVADLETLERYEWTGHAALLGYHPRSWQDTQFVLQQFGSTLDSARHAYRVFVADGLTQFAPELDGGGVRRQGHPRVVDQLARGRERWAFDERVLGGGDFAAALAAEIEAARTPPPVRIDAADFVDVVLPYVASQFDLQIREITTNSRRRAVVQARALISYAAVRNAGLPARRVAPLLGVSPRTVLDGVCLAERRFSPTILADPKLHPRR